jgi:phosphotransferase system  glucose/maltose/N-acetylglucosamine-specific IIC component
MRAYLLRFGISMTAYVVVLVAVDVYFHHNAPEGPLRYLLAVLPAIPILGVIHAMGRYLVEEPDEYVRAQAIRAVLRALGLTLAAATAWGFIENFAGGPQIPMYYVFVVFCAAMGLMRCWLSLGLP